MRGGNGQWAMGNGQWAMGCCLTSYSYYVYPLITSYSPLPSPIPSPMHISQFDFTLPESLIATHPVEPRDASRLLVLPEENDASFIDAHVHQLAHYLREGDVLVCNNTKVIPAQLKGKRGEATIHVTLHQQRNNSQSGPANAAPSGAIWHAFVKPAKKLQEGSLIEFADHFSATVLTKHADGSVALQFNCIGADFDAALHQHGSTPLPPYITKQRKVNDHDQIDYQTMFAIHPGAVAAPTAGLHFTESLCDALDQKGVIRAEVTLHVGAGTFLPVKVDDTDDHIMHHEWYDIPSDTAQIIHQAKAEGRRVFAVGTTSLRTLEAASQEGILQAGCDQTDLFITPGYTFNTVDGLFTNFHIPRSTLFMLVCAFGGTTRMKAAYAHAIAEAYRFYSYGDAMLITGVDQY